MVYKMSKTHYSRFKGIFAATPLITITSLNMVWPFSYSYAQSIGEPIQISDEQAIFNNVNVFNELIDFKISQDGTTVIYRAFENGDFSRELFSVPITGGGAPVRVNAPLPTNGQISLDFEISPDSSTVVYRGEQNDVNISEIFSVPITGGPPIRLLSLIHI